MQKVLLSQPLSQLVSSQSSKFFSLTLAVFRSLRKVADLSVRAAEFLLEAIRDSTRFSCDSKFESFYAWCEEIIFDHSSVLFLYCHS